VLCHVTSPHEWVPLIKRSRIPSHLVIGADSGYSNYIVFYNIIKPVARAVAALAFPKNSVFPIHSELYNVSHLPKIGIGIT
jgi:hypothetical protein